jgi:general secretion pathway protein F
MPSFRFEAIEADGSPRRGLMEAPSRAAALNRLRRDGCVPVRVEAGSGAPGTTPRGTGPRLTPQEVADLVRELAVMLTARQDLDPALRFLAEAAPNRRVAAVLEDIRARLRDGAPLAEALGRHPASFPPGHVGLVRAGEATGRLAEVLERLAAMLERQRRLAATVQSALIYPTLLLLAAVVSVALILGGVLPQFATLFQQGGAPVPESTRWLLAAGDAVAQHGMLALLLLLLAAMGLRQALRWPPLHAQADAWLLRLPGIGALAREVVAARLTRSLGTLLASDVPLIAALAIARDSVGNLAALAALDQATAMAREGRGLAVALAASGRFPPRMTHLLRLGEEHAQLGAMALRAADMHEETSQRSVQRLVALLVPGITIVMGCVVAGIVVTLLNAMLSLNDLAQ